MSRDEENYVALFIDWDNLAISTAVDFAGAVPDVRAIVKAAQRSGTVLLARAYAEWNVSSDRLSVYRAGVEPVYAPTFRFEPEPGSQQPRGKSLADPCLVTDCIDTMHLMPEINTFCLVSGDKDLIPIVRLAQLRGKRVVVIGPDFVAAILRDMADEYIPYRVLAENSDSPPSNEVSLHGARGQRRVAAPTARATSLQTAPQSQARPPMPQRPAPVAPAPRPAPVEANGNAGAPTELASAAVIAEAPPEPIPAEGGQDTAPLFEIIGTIVREREVAGKPRLRATNLKDQLLARITGFDERKYGFARFKDLLASAEKAGVVVVSRTGPVQWVAAPSATPPLPAPAQPAPVEDVAEAAPFVAAPAVEEPAAALAEDEDVDAEVVRFILDLRDRSRWLTYTYLLTNLLNHLGKGAADAAADAAARTTLNRLVQSGVLVVDREPREIDVNGTHHRVRLCHIVDDHPLVARLKAQLATSASAAGGTPAAVVTPTNGAGEAEAIAPTTLDEAIESAPAATTELVEAPPAPLATPPAATVEAAETVAEAARAEPTTAGAPETETAPREVASHPESAPPAEAEPTTPTAEAAAPTGSTEARASADRSDESTAPVSPEVGLGATTRVDHDEDEAIDVGSSNGATKQPLSLADSFIVLRQVVRDATGPNRPSTGPAAVKNRLVRRLGSFDERSFGFSKFKDYLQSAERAGAIRLEVVGTTARVSLPPE